MKLKENNMKEETLNHNSFRPGRESADGEAKAIFGFWVYIMSDTLLFAAIFATHAVLHNNTFDGPSAKELVNMTFVLTETLVLLASSFAFGIASTYAHHHNKKNIVLVWISVTFLLGAAFIGMEMTEFAKLFQEGNSWQRSGFLSGFFTLIGTHGLHVTAGLIWMVSVFAQVLKYGLTDRTIGRISTLGLFWHFLYIVWIFIFTLVYLMGVI
ncbi:MAG: Cytochrome o ubiquinol oxidase, subunit III [Parcubacteria group bacterium GW2011_GWC1_42_11]|uniref:Cytochrome bo(3) ubiquinol oxidase subunit 3 n=1 Tax=Candidatus Nomurabacteria bacterium GW2011_GWC2_42_20 TaxID=1618756 RepID=A0A0G0ZI38_9BACT|nr:MAG: Cytochrome o ubiquinol oxidase, subunit III [Parcubacteria group bacterium GW2011_GWC1_42_11]KKS48344.1 MAG: Cytochrome o ubiquinol oxidase, subunit III [Candidatus Nomurabacteria bacterium GW2011_GWC2_42_20]KKS59012.1 MAG: Cytochrome o ubiquinol oxidase, subunit III [Candidatus Nomurabacteria bacterium GW2011_GWA2_42_41]KKT09920.1 MAG: Cytochrome o ubiquinol oxidase, subunit III [Candidatus Nomurabacteria bacterium GW2011_GWB1_43_20]